jgi:hypothetical protein
MKYDAYNYIWPTRPKRAVPASFLKMYERKKWLGQYKKNGTCNLLFISPQKEITAMTRHNTAHKAWAPTAESNRPFLELPNNGWYVIQTELLHSKVPGIRDTHYIVDILVAGSKYLAGTTFIERTDLLSQLFIKGGEAEQYSHYDITPNVQLAKVFTTDFQSRWTAADIDANSKQGAPLDEGLVLKSCNATLALPTTAISNTKWMVKCRVENKNYSF